MSKLTTQRGRPPRSSANASTIVAESMKAAFVSLIQSLGSRSVSLRNGDNSAASRWLAFVSGESEAPLDRQASRHPEIIGQSLAAYIRNESRILRSRDNARDHEIRTALEESVQSLSGLVKECDNARRQIFDLVTALTSDSDIGSADVHNGPIVDNDDPLLQIQAISRALGESATARRRALNETLACLRMELLDLPIDSKSLYTVLVSSEYLEILANRYIIAGRQLGETVSFVGVRIDPQTSDSVADLVATEVRHCFKRDVDLVARVERHSIVVIAIDTPDRSILELRHSLAVSLSANPLTRKLLSSIEVSLPAIDLTAPHHAETDSDPIRYETILEILSSQT